MGAAQPFFTSLDVQLVGVLGLCFAVNVVFVSTHSRPQLRTRVRPHLRMRLRDRRSIKPPGGYWSNPTLAMICVLHGVASKPGGSVGTESLGPVWPRSFRNCGRSCARNRGRICGRRCEGRLSHLAFIGRLLAKVNVVRDPLTLRLVTHVTTVLTSTG